MISPRTGRLRVRIGELPTAAKWNGLLDLIDEAIRTRPGPGVLRRSLPDATILTARSKGGGTAAMGAYPFRASVSADKDTKMNATFALGLIAGVEPTINGKKISVVDPATGVVPVYNFDTATAIDSTSGRGMLYWQITFFSDWSVKLIEPLASSIPPKAVAYTTWKLIGFLQRDPKNEKDIPTFRQMLFHSLGHEATARHGGAAVHLFWTAS